MATLSKEQVKQIIAKRPPGTTPEGIVAALRETHSLEGYDQASIYDPVNSPGTYPEGMWSDAAQRGLSMVPAAGGFVGGMAGGALGGPVGAVAGAGVGGSLGETIKEAAMGQPLSVRGIATGGVVQAGNELLGQGLVSGAKKVALPLMKRALNSTVSLAERFKTTPEAIARTNLETMRLPVNQGGKQGAEAFNAAIRRARSAKIASTRGTVGPQTLATRAIKDAESLLGRRLTTSERQSLINKVQGEADRILTERSHGAVPKANPGTPAQPPSKILDEYGRPAIEAQPATPGAPSRYTARELEQIKEVAARDARSAYRGNANMTSVGADPALSEQIAASARNKLRNIDGIDVFNAKLRQSMPVELAIDKALRKPGEWTPLHVGPVSVGLKLPPEKLSQIALALTSPQYRLIARQSPRLFTALVTHMLDSAQPDATGGGQP